MGRWSAGAAGVAAAVALVLAAEAPCAGITFSDLDKPPAPERPAPADPPAPPGPVKPDVPPQPAPGPTDTYEQRSAACPQNQKSAVDSLRLPLAKCAATAPPARVLAGEWAMPHESARQHEFLWAIVPLKAGHATFLERYESARTDEERFALADWCRSNGLATCAEFVLRVILFGHFEDHRHPAYQKALEAWRPVAGRRPSPFVFDLPVKGPWYVEEDTSGLHQRKHGTLLAVNLVIQDQRGRQYEGSADEIASYYAWGKPLFAITDGIIVRVEDHYPDPPLRRAGDWRVANAVYQDCGGGVFAFYGHIQKGSAKVKEGDRVERGQALGLVGNSGGNGLPHLHFIVLDGDYFSIPGRFRFEQMTPRGWGRRDGAALEPGTFVRPVSAAAPRP